MLLTPKELSEKYDINESTLRMWTLRIKVKLPTVKRGRYVFIDEDVFKEWMKIPRKVGRRKGRAGGETKIWDKKTIEELKMLAGTMPWKNIAKRLNVKYQTMMKKARMLGLPNCKKPKKERITFLPEYPSKEKFYLNYRAIMLYQRYGNLFNKEEIK